MKKKLCICFMAMCLSAAITSCKKESHAPAVITKPVVLPAMGNAVVSAGNAFAFRFLHAALQQDNADNNKLISPFSIYLALSMVYNGASNATKDSMAATLQLAGIDINDLNAVCKSLLTQLPEEDSRVQLSIANSIWYNQNSFQPLPSFVTTVQDAYATEVKALNFSQPSSVNTINNWAAQKTNNKIPEIIEELHSEDLMYLINAIYFNGAWQFAFDPFATRSGAFYPAGGGTQMVSFMNRQLKTNYYSDSSLTMLELPYGGGNSYSMYIALPHNQQQPINLFAAGINETILANAIAKMDSAATAVQIPKWEYAYQINNMQPALAMLGMNIAFSTDADFSNMYNASQVQPYITKAVHKTYIKVNEEGTEAAAVTSVGMGTTSSSLRYFTADHPFFYTIVEKQTGTILFMGIVTSPPLK